MKKITKKNRFKFPCESSNFKCYKCGIYIFKRKEDYYMLKDEIWNDICKNGDIPYDVLLCRRCAEKIHRRRFTNADLADVPLNERHNWK